MAIDVLFFSHDVDRALSLNGLAYSPLIDTTINAMRSNEIRCKSILLPWSKLKSKNTHNKPSNISNFYLVPAVLDKLANFFLRKNNDIDYNRVQFFKIVIRYYRPKIIISIGAPPYLFKAASLTNTKTAELLHGMGYATIPWNWDILPTEQLPKIIFALDNVSKDTFSKLSSKGVTVYHVSHPFIFPFLRGERFGQEEWRLNLSKSKQFKKTVLLTLNWGYGGDHGPYMEFKGIYANGLFDEVLLEAIRETSTDVFWRIRLHPVHLRKKEYGWVRNYVTRICEIFPNCEWENSSRVPLPVVAIESDCHITMISMSSYDCACLGLNTLALCPTLQKGGKNEMMFDDLEKEGLLVKVEPVKSKIINWLNLSVKRQIFGGRLSETDIVSVVKNKIL